MRSSAGPRPGQGAWDEVPRRPVIEPVIAIVIVIVIDIVIGIDTVIVIRPVIVIVIKSYENRNDRRRPPAGCCRCTAPAKGFSERTASATGHGHKE